MAVLDFGAVARLPEQQPARGDGPADPDRRDGGQGGAARGAARGGVRQAGHPARPRPAARLPLPVRRADAGGAVPVLPGVDAHAVRADQQPPRADVHDRDEAEPAAGRTCSSTAPGSAGSACSASSRRRRRSGRSSRSTSPASPTPADRGSALRAAGTSRAGRRTPASVSGTRPGTVPTISKPSDSQRRTAAMLVSTTALNWMPRKPWSRCHCTTYSASRRPTPRPRAASATMNDAVPTWSPWPGRFGPILALPRISPSSSSTTVRPGGRSSQRPRRLLGGEVERVGVGLPRLDRGVEERPDPRPVLVGGRPDRGIGHSPVTPSMDSRIRSAWPLCRAYSSIMCSEDPAQAEVTLPSRRRLSRCREPVQAALGQGLPDASGRTSSTLSSKSARSSSGVSSVGGVPLPVGVGVPVDRLPRARRPRCPSAPR